MFACHAGGVESIHEMMPFLQPKDVNLALIWAAEQGKVSVVDLILKSPYISLDGLDQSYSALFLASSGRHLEVMRSLLQAGANPNGRSKGVRHEPYASPLTPVPTSQDTVRALGSTPLHALCGMRQNSRRRQNDRESVKKCFDLLLAAGCDINAINSEHRTALHYSISRSAHTSEDISLHNLLSFLLLENGANPSIADKHGDTPLHLLQIHTKSAQVLEALLRNGADLYARRPADGRTPIHNMLDSTYTLDIKTLLTHVTNWNVQDNKGDSPLHIVFANSQNPQDFVTDLLNAGADLSLKNKNGQVPHFALRDMSCKPSNPILPTLVAAGADLESRDNDGRTFLLSALNIKVKRGDTMYTIQRLLDLGVNINVVDNDGNGKWEPTIRY
jgi:cytohesin